MKKYEIAIIGGGPAGYIAALKSSSLGKKTVLVENHLVGGTCLNYGCIPAKTLLESSRLRMKLKEARDFGLIPKEGEALEFFTVDMKKIVERKNGIVARLRSGLLHLLKVRNVDVISGKGNLISPGKIQVIHNGGDGVSSGSVEEFQADAVIIATGSKTRHIPGLEPDGRIVITSQEALEQQEVPPRLLIVGGGVIGLEFASFFSGMGSRVVVVEMMDQILPGFDRSIARRLELLLKRQNIEFRLKTTVSSLEIRDNRASVTLGDSGEKLEFERVLLAAGRIPCLDGLEKSQLALDDKGFVVTNERMETSLDGVYAAGDVTSRLMLAHVASKQGEIAAINAAGGSASYNPAAIPVCVYTTPEVASCGKNSDTGGEEGVEVIAGRFPFQALGRALALGEAEGYVEMFSDRQTGRILGMNVIGPHASELIAECVLAMEGGVTVKQLAETIHAHPTLSEAVMEAAGDVLGISMHLPPKKGNR